MDLSYLEKVLRLFDDSTLTELEIEEEGSQIRLARQKEPATIQYAPPPQYAYGPVPTAAPGPASSAAESPVSSAKTHEVKSPIVGTMYRAPSPDADQYVQVGQQVEVGTTLCIIEAMKLMNEIESDAAGKIIKICVENGQPVEYGQTLFILETA
ncbi:MAG: acetyl-CoA carboxylase biotin carboxyl carrier protein [Candidatus Kapaibacterium sp.]